MKTQSYMRVGTSKKRAKDYVVYRRRKRVFLDTHDKCFACGEWIRPQNRDLHHTRGRAGSLYLDERFWEMVCRDCHTRIHENPKWAVRMGFMAGPGEWNKVPR